MQRFEYSDAGVALTKQFEGLRLAAYQDSGGVWTVGYGHTGADVHPGETITEAEAEGLLRVDVIEAAACVNSVMPETATQGQFDACVDFAFNLGTQALRGSHLLAYWKAGDLAAAAMEFGRWVHDNGKVLPGLVKRRAAEAAMFQGR